jgi:hypothetical protein
MSTTDAPSCNPLWPEPGPSGTCASCVWRYSGGRGKPVDRCRRHADQRVSPGWPACPAFEASVDCLECGACCREAYHAVEVSRRDAFVKLHPERIVEVDGRLNVRRSGDRCSCLAGELGAFHCVLYADRPRTCRDFEQGGANCVDARRRVGLTK